MAHDLFGILVDDHLYFVDGNLTFGDISNLLVKDIFTEREITDVRGKPFETITSRTKIIDLYKRYRGKTFGERLIRITKHS